MWLGWTGFRPDLKGTKECNDGNANNGDGEYAYKKVTKYIKKLIEYRQKKEFRLVYLKQVKSNQQLKFIELQIFSILFFTLKYIWSENFDRDWFKFIN